MRYFHFRQETENGLDLLYVHLPDGERNLSKAGLVSEQVRQIGASKFVTSYFQKSRMCFLVKSEKVIGKNPERVSIRDFCNIATL